MGSGPPIRSALSIRDAKSAALSNSTGRVAAMSLKNFVLVIAAAGAFAGAIVVAAAPEPLRISYAVPTHKTPK